MTQDTERTAQTKDDFTLGYEAAVSLCLSNSVSWSIGQASAGKSPVFLRGFSRGARAACAERVLCTYNNRQLPSPEEFLAYQPAELHKASRYIP